MSERRVVCALSGGGAKAAAHVGALKALEEWKLKPQHIVGTSMGAVMGACFASGLGYDDVVQRVSAVSRRDVANLTPTLVLGPFARSLLRARPLRKTIATLVPARRFDALAIPLTVTAVNVTTGELVLFGPGGRTDVPLVDALYASSALPLYYPPALIAGAAYADGGLRAVLPLDVAGRFAPELVFAVSVGPTLAEEAAAAAAPPGLIRAHDMAVRILMAAQEHEVLARWTQNGRIPVIVVRPALPARATFAVGSAVSYIEEGYRAAYRALSEWQSHP